MEEPSKKPKPTITERIAKLPKDIRDYIQNAERERDVAARELKEYTDNQTPSEFSIQEYVNGKFVTRYIQTNKIEIEAHGVKLVVRVGFDRDKCLNLQWGPAGRLAGTQHVGFAPTSFQAAEIRSKENMR
jgi:hypothetical protein